jgi:predicted nucleotidyltransferase
MNYQHYIPKIVNELKKASPERIILFGSYAYGNPTSDSDLDIMVVSNDNTLPESYKEKSEIYLKIAHLIDDIRSEIPVDLIVHTKPMHKIFNQKNSMFSREVKEKGKVLYDINSK